MRNLIRCYRVNYPSSKLKCLAFHTKLCRKQSTLLERLPLQMKRPPTLSCLCVYIHDCVECWWLTILVYLYSNEPVLKQQTCVPCHTSLRLYTITWICKQFMYCTSLSAIFLCVCNIHNWYLQDQGSNICFYYQSKPWQK